MPRAIVTLGFGLLCLKDNPSRLQLVLIWMLQPAVFFFLIFLIWFMPRFRLCFKLMQSLQQRRSLAQVLWLVILYSHIFLAFSPLIMITCIKVGNQWLFFLDPSVTCFSSTHAPYGVFSIVFLVVFMILPCILCGLRCVQFHPRFKELMDEATHFYQDKYRWYVSVDISRRFALAAFWSIGILMDYQTRCLWRAMFFIFLTIFHSSIR